MDVRKWTLPGLALASVLMACNVFGVPLLTPTASAPVIASATPPDIPPLTIGQVLNAVYTITTFDDEKHVYQLVNGDYQHGADPAALDYVSVNLAAIQNDQKVVFGDLNRDGVEDAGVLIAENYGGTGVFVSAAAVLNENGRPRHAASYAIDDRPSINSLAIREGEIFLDAIVHGPNDPGCCPSMAVTRTLRLIQSQLRLVRASSKTPAGDERAITITAPANGAEVPNEINLTGSVTIAPFENNLGMIIYNLGGNELANRYVQVAAPDLGAPGTFNASLNLTGLPRGPVLLIVADFSAADGAVLALDSVELVIH